MSDIIGYLFSKRRYIAGVEIDGTTDYVKCPDCMGKPVNVVLDYRSPLFEVNILPYRQTCHTCHKLLVAGQSPAWCELYVDEPGPITRG
jgi:hypothetical protein